MGHSQLLARSPKNLSITTNVDIIFAGVKYINLPFKMDGLIITSPEATDYLKATKILGRIVKEAQLFIFQLNNRRHIVVAAGMKILENEPDIFETSLEIFNADINPN